MADLTFTKYYGDGHNFSKLGVQLTDVSGSIDVNVFVVRLMDDPMQVGAQVPYLLSVASRADMQEYDIVPVSGTPYRTSSIELIVEDEDELDPLVAEITRDVEVNVDLIQRNPLVALQDIWIPDDPALWTPDLLTSIVWLDASDETTITSSLDAVSQWADKSGNDHHVSEDAGSQQPLTDQNVIGGLNVISFLSPSANRHRLKNESLDPSLFSDDSPLSVYMVSKNVVNDTTEDWTFGLYDSTGLARISFGDTGYLQQHEFLFRSDSVGGTDSKNPGTNSSDADVNPHVWSLVADAIDMEAIKDGTSILQGNRQVTDGGKPQTIDSICLGQPKDDEWNTGWSGDLGELILVNERHNEKLRQTVEGYLAHKWGLQANLPSGHPYKSQPPRAISVVGAHLFYEDSFWDAPKDDDAIAPDKEPLLPGEEASFANVSSYYRGINGIMIDVYKPNGTPELSDFSFKMGNDLDPGNWGDAPAPVSIETFPGTGENGSDRIKIIWNDGDIADTWLQVTVKSSCDNIGLAEDYVFYYGSLIGETGDDPAAFEVTVVDEDGVRDNLTGLFDAADIDNVYDFTRRKAVDTADILVTRNAAGNSIVWLSDAWP